MHLFLGAIRDNVNVIRVNILTKFRKNISIVLAAVLSIILLCIVEILFALLMSREPEKQEMFSAIVLHNAFEMRKINISIYT